MTALARPSEALAALIEPEAVAFDCANPPGTVGLPQALTVSQAISLFRCATALERLATVAEAREARESGQ